MAHIILNYRFICSVLMITVSLGLEPGYKMYFTKKGLSYLTKVANQNINPKYFMLNGNETLEKLDTLTLPDLTVEIMQMNFDVDKSFGSSLLFKPNVGFLHLIENASLLVDGRYRTSKNDSGFYVINGDGVYVQSTIRLQNDMGRLKITMEKCKCEIWSIDFKLLDSGGLSTSLIKDSLKSALPAITKAIKNAVCKFENSSFVEYAVASKFVNFNEQNEVLFNTYVYNGSLSEDILINKDYLQTSHDGGLITVSQQDDDNEHVNYNNVTFDPPQISLSNAINESSFFDNKQTHMLYVLMSNYSLNSLLYELWSKGSLSYKINDDTVDPIQATYLQTNCGEFGMCASLIIPALSKLYPNGTLDVTMRAESSPTVEILAGKVRIMTRGYIGCNIRHNGREDFLFSSDADLILEIQKIQLSDYSSDIRVADFSLQNFNSSTPEVDEAKVTLLINFAKDMFFGVDLSDKFQNTVAVPKLLDYDIDHKSSRVQFLTDVIKISLNFLL